ncbi:uncharacterized protein [Centruroides vittatus]
MSSSSEPNVQLVSGNTSDVKKILDGLTIKNKSLRASLGSIILYGTCSMLMVFINKFIFTSYMFKFPFFIMACQMISTVILLELCSFLKCIKLNPYNIKKGFSFVLPSIFYAIHSVLALNALGGMNIPMYGAIKRCTPFVTLLLTLSILHKKWPSCKIFLSIGLITLGCITAGLGDLTFDIWAYFYGVLSVIAQGFYLILVQRSAEKNMATLDILQLNSYNTFPIFILLGLMTEEFTKVLLFLKILDVSFLLCLTAEIGIGFILNYSLFLCTTLNSALTTSLVGIIKSMFQTLIGFMTFGGVKFHYLNAIGLSLNIVGGFIYTYEKYKEKLLMIKYAEENETPKISC